MVWAPWSSWWKKTGTWNIILVSGIQGCFPPPPLEVMQNLLGVGKMSGERGQRMKKMYRVSEKKSVNRALVGHVIRRGVQRLDKEDFNPSRSYLWGEDAWKKGNGPVLVSIATDCMNTFSGDRGMTPTLPILPLTIPGTYTVLSPTSISQYHFLTSAPPGLAHWASCWISRMYGCMNVHGSHACIPQKGSVLRELYLDPMSHSL